MFSKCQVTTNLPLHPLKVGERTTPGRLCDYESLLFWESYPNQGQVISFLVKPSGPGVTFVSYSSLGETEKTKKGKVQFRRPNGTTDATRTSLSTKECFQAPGDSQDNKQAASLGDKRFVGLLQEYVYM